MIKILTIGFFFISLLTHPVHADMHSSTNEKHSPTDAHMFMVGTFELISEDEPVEGVQVTLRNQTRTSDEAGIVQFDDVHGGANKLDLQYQGKVQTIEVDVTAETTQVTIPDKWKDGAAAAATDTEQAQAGNLLSIMLLVLISFGVAMYLIHHRNMLVGMVGKKNNRKHRRMVIASFLVMGLISFSAMSYQIIAMSGKGTQAFIGNTMAAEMSSIPTPLNVRAFPDDRVATVQWDTPNNASANKIVGYIVRWGKKSDGVMTDSRQTIYNQVQMQPIENGVEYIVSVQSVTGSVKNQVTRDGITYQGDFAVADGNYSKPVQITVTGTTKRVDDMRSRLTGFFDDFNLPAGNLDERKWNTAYTGCADPGENGAFINSQFHAHNQVRARSDYVDSQSDLPYCDRAATASRPRAIFDTTGATKDNPAVIEMDVDGAIRNRDIWYIDLIPVNARLNGVPLDLEGHDDFFQADSNEPGSMLRITQTTEGISFHTWNANRQATKLDLTYSCQGWLDNKSSFQWCDLNKQNWIKTTKYSSDPQADGTVAPVPNVRKHWVVEYSPSEVVLYINGIKVAAAKPPQYIADVKKFQVTSEIFSYTTGKDYTFMDPAIKPQTTLMHWDNFGFSGPTPATVTHNYIDGGSTGSIPQIATGTLAHPFEKGNRTSRIPIPDQIGSPVQARLMFTLNPLGNYAYSWSSSDNVRINGKEYKFPNPNDNIPGPDLNPIASAYTPHSTGIIISPQDLKTGMNDIQLNLGTDVTNVHIELDYPKASAPSFTQPQQVFSQISYNDFIIPKMRFSDSYLFIEQDMGLRMGAGNPQPTTAVTVTQAPTSTVAPTVRPSNTPVPTQGPSVTPFPTATRAPSPTAAPTVVVPSPTVAPTSIPSGATLGNTSVGSMTDSSNSNFINSLQVKTGGQSRTVKSMSVYVGEVDSAPNNKFQVAIYADNNGKPGALVAKSGAGTLQGNAWNTVAITANLNANTTYWLAYNTNGRNAAVNNMKYSAGGVDAYSSKSRKYGNWPASFGASVRGNLNFSIYASF